MKRFLILLLILLSSLYCDRSKGQLEDGDHYLADGDIVRALEIYQQLDTSDPAVKGRIGLILSLDPVTMITGMRMISESVTEKPDFRLRKHLFILYLQTGLHQKADVLLDAESVSLDRYFSPEFSVLRKGYACYKNPDKPALKELTEEPSGDAPWFALLCLMNKAYNRFQSSDEAGKEEGLRFAERFADSLTDPSELLGEEDVKLFNLLNRSVPEKEKCELHLFLNARTVAGGLTLDECKEQYPDSLLLIRGRLPRLTGADFRRENGKLFDDSNFYPDHIPVDRPEYDPDYEPPWQEEVDESEIENYENFQRNRRENGPDTNP